jgi:biopolymer transport protein ExbD
VPLALGVLLALGACRLPPAADHAALHIAPDGALTLDGQPVTLATLGAAVQARHRGDIPLEVDITASPLAAMDVVNQVVHTSTAAHATVAFAEISAASSATASAR